MQAFKFSMLCVTVVVSSQVATAQQKIDFESPPVFSAAQILPTEMLKGEQHRVRDYAPSDGFLIHFTMDTNFGVINARGLDELAVRVHEMDAIQLLVETSRSDLFAEGLKRSIEAPIDAVKNIAADPKESLRKAPATIGHFFQKVGSSISNASDKVEDKWEKRDNESSFDLAESSKGLGNAAKGIVGFDKAKLDCARKLGVNPYSDNSLLQEQMTEVSWAFFAGGLPLKLGASAVSGGASMTLSATKVVGIPEDLYDVTPSELALRDRMTMEQMGAGVELIEQMFLNPSLSIALRHGMVGALKELPEGIDRVNVLGLASTCNTVEQARYFYQVLEKLKARHTLTSYKALTTVGRMPAALTNDGVLEVVAPVDYLSWTPQIAQFATTPKIPQQKYRAVIYGKISKLAAAGFEASGWEVIEL